MEKKIVEARLKGLSIGQLSENDLKIQVMDALVSISIITGHGLPEEPAYAKRLITEIIVQLLEFGYSDLNIDEIILAFRLNCLCNLRFPSGSEVTPVEIFGKYISVDYITKVLSIYRTLRNILDRQLINSANGY